MVSVDQNIFPSVPDLYTALAVMFASFFVFNLEYNPSAVATLEYIQRYTYLLTHTHTHTDACMYDIVCLIHVCLIFTMFMRDRETWLYQSDYVHESETLWVYARCFVVCLSRKHLTLDQCDFR